MFSEISKEKKFPILQSKEAGTKYQKVKNKDEIGQSGLFPQGKMCGEKQKKKFWNLGCLFSDKKSWKSAIAKEFKGGA